MKRRKKQLEVEDFEMAPMIDMVFLLLVFFMTVSTMAQDARPDMVLADSTAAEAKADQEPGYVISLGQSGDERVFYFEGLMVAEEELQNRVKDSVAEGKELDWVVRAEKSIPWKDVETLLSLLRKEGASNLRFATFVE